MNKQRLTNPFFLVGMVIGICMLICGIYGIYDCVTDNSIFWPGIYGALVLLVAEPTLFLLLMLDVGLWFLYRRKNRSKEETLL